MAYELWLVVGAPVVRALGGWAENAFRDGVVDFPEWRRLAQTLLRVGLPALFLFYGLEWSAGLAASVPVLADILLNQIGKMLKKSKE